MFRQYYGMVCNTINHYLHDRNRTEDVAQEMFAELWSKRQQLTIHTSVPAYLRRMAVTRTLNYIRDSRKYNWDELESPDSGISNATVEPDILNSIEASEMQHKIDQAIQQLPEKCRVVFLMSRMEEMSYAEIASQLGISIKTVENQIGKALKLLRLYVSGIGGNKE
jgi:RNA polymerase sigma-70 factor (ECF subfamily)